MPSSDPSPSPARYSAPWRWPRPADAGGKHGKGYNGHGHSSHSSGHSGSPWNNAKTNVQLGPRPFYLVDKMTNGPLKAKLEQCENRKFTNRKFSIAHRGAPLQFPRAHRGRLSCRRAHGRRHRRVRRDLHQGRRTGLPSFAVRPAHHDQHPGHPAGLDLRDRLPAGRIRRQRQPDEIGRGEVLHQRPDAGGVQVAERQDGRQQLQRDDGRGIHGGHGELAHRPVFDRRHADVAQGKHRAVQEARRRHDA